MSGWAARDLVGPPGGLEGQPGGLQARAGSARGSAGSQYICYKI